LLIKIVLDNKFLQVKNFKFLGCDIPYENEKDLTKLAKFAQLLRIWNNTSKPNLIEKVSRIKCIIL